MKYKKHIILFLLFITATSFVFCTKFCNKKTEPTPITIPTTPIEDSIANDTITPIDIIVPIDTTTKETKPFNKYIKIIKYELTEFTQVETFVFAEGNEYIIGSNSNDIFIYFHVQENTDTKKNMKLKFIGNGKSISYLCKKTEVHHIKFRVVSNKDKKYPYEGILYLVAPEK